MLDVGKIMRAASFAAKKHAGQKRKGADGEPYINHPLEVASLLTNVGGIDDTDVITAALLHDTVEDTGVSLEEIEKEFGSAVAGYVGEVTDDKSLAKADRKRLQVEHAPHLSHGAKQIKLADKISNIRDVTSNPPDGWDNQRRREYVQWGSDVVAGLRGANRALEAEFDKLVESSKEVLNRAAG
jgi:GTP diphosphokinase / guanosine-3',5'-bis(diphosphate) 3'-diphosphatase